MDLVNCMEVDLFGVIGEDFSFVGVGGRFFGYVDVIGVVGNIGGCYVWGMLFLVGYCDGCLFV